MMTLMQTFRNRFFMTFISWTVILQLFNTSIDPADPHYGPEDLTINDIESCVEFVLEIVLGHTDAIDEVDDQNEDSGNPTSAFTLFAAERILAISKKEFEISRQENCQYIALAVPNFCPAILCPPPRTI